MAVLRPSVGYKKERCGAKKNARHSGMTSCVRLKGLNSLSFQQNKAQRSYFYQCEANKQIWATRAFISQNKTIFLLNLKSLWGLKVQCVEFRRICLKNMAEIEYNIHKYVITHVQSPENGNLCVFITSEWAIFAGLLCYFRIISTPVVSLRRASLDIFFIIMLIYFFK